MYLNELGFIFSFAKAEIEQRQRDKVKNGEKTILRFFDWVENDPVKNNLEDLISGPRDDRYVETGSWVHKSLSFAK